MAIKLLVDMLDIPRILPDQHRSEIFNRTHDCAGLPFERRLPPTEQACLVRDDFNEDPIAHLRVDDYRSYVGNFHKVLYCQQRPGAPYLARFSRDMGYH